MKKINKRIEIVCSDMPRLSSMSKPSRNAIWALLSKHYASVEITTVTNLADLEALALRNPDLVFLGTEYVLDAQSDLAIDNKLWVSRFLDANDIAYTGSSQMALELGRDKAKAKMAVADAGLSTSPFYVAGSNKLLSETNDDLSFPLFVKPISRGGGVGIDNDSVVHNQEELHAKVTSIALQHQSDSLVEKYLPGREFSIAILKNEVSRELIVMPLELIAPLDMNGNRILSAAIKSSDTESFIGVEEITLRTKIIDFAVDAFRALGARDYGRIDVRLDDRGEPQFLEVNLLPSLIEGYGNFPKACQLNIGMEYQEMILSIVKLGLGHNNLSEEEELEASPELLP